MEARDIPAGLRQSVTSLVYKLCTDILFRPDQRLHFENSFVQCSEFLICKLRSKSRVSSDHAGMKNISVEVSIFCLWTNWIHLVTCSKIEFPELHCCSRCALDKIFDILHFRSLFTGVVWSKIIFDLWRRKKEKWRTTRLFLKHVS